MTAQVKNSSGLTPAGIAVVTVVCIVILGIFVLAGIVIYRLRNRIKERRSKAFHSMDAGNNPGAAGGNNGEVAMNPL